MGPGDEHGSYVWLLGIRAMIASSATKGCSNLERTLMSSFSVLLIHTCSQQPSEASFIRSKASFGSVNPCFVEIVDGHHLNSSTQETANVL